MYVLANYGMGNCFICKEPVRPSEDRIAATLCTWKGEQMQVSVALCSDCIDGLCKMALRGKAG